MAYPANYTLSLHDALPIFRRDVGQVDLGLLGGRELDFRLLRRLLQPLQRKHVLREVENRALDRKSTRLNSSHRCISYAVFCLKKKKQATRTNRPPVARLRY